jgi:thiosulfate/3-mercaptopyruvate sulfurtransferase
MTGNLVTCTWLAQKLDAPHVRIIDASWHLPTAKRDAKAEFEAKHIPGAQFYDLDVGAAPDTSLPHMMPSASKFAADMAKLGIGNGSHVIVYDSVGLFSAARLWWMLRSFGHDKVSILDGGLKKWEADGLPVSSVAREAGPAHFNARPSTENLRTLKEVGEALASQAAQVVDARSATRFRGEEPEPRSGVRPGHMPGARNVHYASLINADGTLKAEPDLRAAFEAAGVDLAKPIITSCGSGVTAAILILALEEIGHTSHALYDGSWAEWGASGEAVAIG